MITVVKERKIRRLLYLGRSVRDIAEAMGLSENEVAKAGGVQNLPQIPRKGAML